MSNCLVNIFKYGCGFLALSTCLFSALMVRKSSPRLIGGWTEHWMSEWTYDRFRRSIQFITTSHKIGLSKSILWLLIYVTFCNFYCCIWFYNVVWNMLCTLVPVSWHLGWIISFWYIPETIKYNVWTKVVDIDWVFIHT